MSQTLLRRAFGVSGHYRLVRTDFERGGVQFLLDLKEEALICPECRLSDEVIRKGSRCRCLQTVPIGLKAVHLLTEVARCRCRRCNLLFEVSPPLPGRTWGTRASSRSLWIA